MWFLKVLAVSFCVARLSGPVAVLASGSNMTDGLLTMNEEQIMKGRFLGVRGKKQPRFLSFNTLDNEISVEMQLGVPFLSIPIKKSINSATGFLSNLPMANVNLGAIGLAGVAILSSVIIIPFLVKLVSVNFINGGNKRSDDADPSVLLQFQRMLSENGVPLEVCTQRVLCAYIRQSSRATDPTSVDKIIDGLASNEWVLGALNGTFLSKAISSGYSEESCAAVFARCKVNQSALHNIAKTVSNMFTSESNQL